MNICEEHWVQKFCLQSWYPSRSPEKGSEAVFWAWHLNVNLVEFSEYLNVIGYVVYNYSLKIIPE